MKHPDFDAHSQPSAHQSRDASARLRPMRGLKTDRTASIVIRGHAFTQNLRRGHRELGVEVAPALRLATAFEELRLAI